MKRLQLTVWLYLSFFIVEEIQIQELYTSKIVLMKETKRLQYMYLAAAFPIHNPLSVSILQAQLQKYSHHHNRSHLHHFHHHLN